MFSILKKLIKEEIQNLYHSDDNELNVLDKYFTKNYGYDKTQNDVKINAELVGYVDKQYHRPLETPIPVYKNPQTLNGFYPDTRGILLSNGDLYLAKSYEALHDNILDLLTSKNIIPVASKHGYHYNYPEEFVAVVRIGTSKTFEQSSAYDFFPEYYHEIFRIGEEIQPYGFHYLNF